MKQRVPEADPYAENFDAAVERSGMRNTHIAHTMDINVNLISIWRRGHQPIPPIHALRLATLVGETPERISRGYDQLLKAGVIPSWPHMPPPQDHVFIPRLLDFGRGDGPEGCYLPEFLLRRELGTTPLDAVRWAHLPSLALTPLIKRDALMLVDSRICDHANVVDGAVYAFTLWGRPEARRILLRRNHWQLVGQSAESERVDIYDDDMEQLKLFGMVVGWL